MPEFEIPRSSPGTNAAAHVYAGGSFVPAVAYIYTDGSFRPAEPKIYLNEWND